MIGQPQDLSTRYSHCRITEFSQSPLKANPHAARSHIAKVTRDLVSRLRRGNPSVRTGSWYSLSCARDLIGVQNNGGVPVSPGQASKLPKVRH